MLQRTKIVQHRINDQHFSGRLEDGHGDVEMIGPERSGTMTTKAKSTHSKVKQAKQSADANKETMEQAMTMNKEQVEKASKSILKGYDDMTQLSQKNVEAIVAAGNVWAKGAESIGKAYFNMLQVSAEAGVEATQAMFAAKTVKEAVDLQSGFAKSNVETLVTEGKKINEITAKVANEAFEPIQAQLNETVETLLKQTAR